MTMRGWMGSGLALAGIACGGQSVPTPGPAQPLASWSYAGVDGPVPGGTSVLTDQCLTQPLPVGSDREPDCVFIRAVYPHGSASAADVAACQACNAPGEAAVPSSITLDSIGTGLSGYDCLCVVEALPAAAACPPSGGFTATSPAAWCYAASQPTCGAKGGTSSLEFSPAASQGSVLYGACFTPGTFPVTTSG